jgi:hexosaminidase
VLQDVSSWIVMPTEVSVEVSADGRTFRPAGRVGHDVAVEQEGVIRRDLVLELDGTPVRSLRFTAPNAGPLPAWHPGAGGASFVFVDELIVE